MSNIFQVYLIRVKYSNYKTLQTNSYWYYHGTSQQDCVGRLKWKGDNSFVADTMHNMCVLGTSNVVTQFVKCCLYFLDGSY